MIRRLFEMVFGKRGECDICGKRCPGRTCDDCRNFQNEW